MWSRIEGVAGKVRTNVSQLAKDVLEGGEDDSPQQGGDFSAFTNAFQHQSTSQPLPPQYVQPYPQAAGVYVPQQAAARPVQAKPLTQPHKPLQQIPFMPQRSTATQPAVKPNLFVPNQAQSQHATPTADGVVNALSPTKAAKPIVTGSTQLASSRPAVSSRLSALKAKLDQEKHRIAEDKSRDRQLQSALPVQGPARAHSAGIKPIARPAWPPISFASQSHAPAKPKSSQHTEPSTLPSAFSSSAKQLQDLGFVEVDLDSPDLIIGKSQPEQTSQAVRQHSVPIPFMQTAAHSQSSTPTSQTEEHSQLNAWPHADDTSQLAFKNSPPASPLFQPAGHTSVSDFTGQDSSYNSPTKAMSVNSLAPTAPSQAQPSISAFAQGPYDMTAQGYGTASIHSGSPSIASSAPTSPGQQPSGVVPSRRSSFLPRGMSSHLHKALRATAAAASKATAAIAPPPNSSQAAAAQMWQPEADAPASQTDPGAADTSQHQEEAFVDQEEFDSAPWGPTAAPAAQQAGKEAPWWQKQLRNLQQNLQSQSEDGSPSELDSISGSADGSAQHQQGFPEQLSGHNLDELPVEPSSNGNDPYAVPSQAHSSLADSGNQLPFAEAHMSANIGNGQDFLHDESTLWHQHPVHKPAFAGSPADLDGFEQMNGDHDSAQAESQDSYAHRQTAQPLDATHQLSATESQPLSTEGSVSVDALDRADGADTEELPSRHAEEPYPFPSSQQQTAITVQASVEPDALPGSSLNIVPDGLQLGSNEHYDSTSDSQILETSQQSAELQISVTELRRDFAAVQQRLAASEAECSQLRGMLSAHSEAAETSEQTHAQLEQHWRSQSQQQQQELRTLQQQLAQQLAQQQAQHAQQASSGTGFKQELHRSQQQVQALQVQLSQQQEQLEQAESTIQDLETQLDTAQRQADTAAANLARYQQEADTMQQQMCEQQQAEDRNKQLHQSMQAAVRDAQAECKSLQQELAAAQQQAGASEQRLQDRDAVWQEELQQQQSRSDKLQQELDALRAAFEQQQPGQQEETQPGSSDAAMHHQDELIAQLTGQVQQARQDLAGQRAKTMALQQALEDQGEEMESAQASAVASAAASEDLHASLEAQLRSSQADVARLQSEASRLRDTAATAADAQSLAESPASTSSITAKAQAGLEQQLRHSQAEVVSLRNELRQLQSAASVSAASDSEQSANQRHSQQASTSGQRDSHADAPGVAPADQLPPDASADMQQQLLAVELERDKAKQQLSRLKQQLMNEQEDEEDKVRWRVDAEVKLALQEAQAAQAQQGLADQEEVVTLRQEVAAGAAQIQQMQQDLQAWEDAVTARDAELRNLQAALGELTFESEAATGLRAELRAAQEQASSLQQQLQQSHQQVQQSKDALRDAQQAVAAASHGTEEQQTVQKQLQDETAMLRRALKESMGRLASLSDEGNVQVDRRIVVKLLVTFFEKGQSKEVLQLMARILNFTDEDKARVGLTGPRRGVLSRVAGRLSLTSSDTKQDSDSSLADQWLDFLVQQAEAADAAEVAAKVLASSQVPAEPASAIGKPVSAVQHNWNSMQSPLNSDM